MNPKQRAAEAAVAYVKSGMVVGLGTGSTADYFLQALAGALKAGLLHDIRGVPTSRQSERRAQHLQIPLASLGETPTPDVTVDGADEIDPHLDLIKGLGGALLREKVVAQNSRKLIIIADAAKRVPRLGTRAPLPVEVAQFGYETHEAFFRSLGAQPKLRAAPGGMVFVTDNGNFIYDLHFADGIADARKLEMTLETRAGVVECGLFLGLASVVITADESLIHTLTRP